MLRRNQGRSASSGSKSSGGPKTGSGAQELKFHTEDAPGMKVSPKTVLITSLIYIGIVVLLHIWGKIRQEPAKPDAAAP
jgi:protein transport protein SEC61 subunit beta